MKSRQVIGISVLSSLLTVALILALLTGTGAVGAQGPAPRSGSAASQSPEWFVPSTGNADLFPAEEGPNATAAATDYLHVAGSSFVPLWDTTSVAYFGSGCTSLGGGNLFLNYGLALPYGSTVTELRLYYKDYVASVGTLWLAEYNDGLGYTYVVTATTSGDGGWGTRAVSVNVPLNYVDYSYSMVWSPGVPGTDMQLCGFRVAYSRPLLGAAAMPMVMRNP